MAPAEHRVIKVAHRGGAGLAPENTLAAFRVGLEQGADALELDVHLSSDGELVVIHDPILARTTNAAGEVGGMTLAELRLLDASARFFRTFRRPPAHSDAAGSRGPREGPRRAAGRDQGARRRDALPRHRGEGRRDPPAERHGGRGGHPVVRLSDARRGEGDRAAPAHLRPDLQSLSGEDRQARSLRRWPERWPPSAQRSSASRRAGCRSRCTGSFVPAAWASAPGPSTTRETMRKFALMGVDFITSNRPDLLREALAPAGGWAVHRAPTPSGSGFEPVRSSVSRTPRTGYTGSQGGCHGRQRSSPSTIS